MPASPVPVGTPIPAPSRRALDRLHAERALSDPSEWDRRAHQFVPQFADPRNGDDWLHGIYNPEWSPDGSRLVFPNGALAGWPIWTADADGSDPGELVSCGDGCQFLDAPAFSPDGHSLAYVRFVGEWPPSTLTYGSALEDP